MKRLLSLMLCLALPVLVFAQPMYRWVDEDGTVHYSDKPVEGAERVEMRELSTYENVETLLPQARRDAAQDTAGEAVEYESARIAAPEDGAVVWVTGGEMHALVAVEPPLQAGHQVALYVNGTLADGTPVADTRVSLTGMIRGTHQLVAAILDADGEELLRSPPVTIHARAHSVNDPQRKR